MKINQKNIIYATPHKTEIFIEYFLVNMINLLKGFLIENFVFCVAGLFATSF